MEISKNSWHYWLVTKIAKLDRPSQNLCTYFWQVVWALVLTIFLVLLAIGMAFAPFAIFGLMAVPQATGVLTTIWALVLAFGTVAWMVAGGLLTVFALLAICFFTKELYEKYRPEPEDRKPSPAGSYIRAKKSKICPVLTFKDK